MQSPIPTITAHLRPDWVRLTTLVAVRWYAITGQLVAILAATRFFDLDVDVGLCLLPIGAGAIGNIAATMIYPENKRMSEVEVALMLIFDIVQLTALLALTGGLNNPFALLIMAPVTLSAMALRPRTTALIAGLAVTLISTVAVAHVPLRTASGDVLTMPDIFLTGFWVAIVIGTTFLSVFAQRVTAEIGAMSDALSATQMALAREQKLTDLGGVVAATAHEMGSPLATIKLTSAELLDELADRPDLAEDAALIGAEADRCRDILRSMGRAGKDDAHTRYLPFGTMIEEAAEPHANRGKAVHFSLCPEAGGAAAEPIVERRPEVIHGLRNLIQNAVDFAQGNVWIDARWSLQDLRLRIADDGPGYPPQILGRIGDPFMRHRRGEAADERPARPGYDGMGLGLFIAKTLLERSGAELSFANGGPTGGSLGSPVGGRGSGGAVVELFWREGFSSETPPLDRRAMGQNRPIET